MRQRPTQVRQSPPRRQTLWDELSRGIQLPERMKRHQSNYQHSTATLEATQSRPSGLSEEPTEMSDLKHKQTHHVAQF